MSGWEAGPLLLVGLEGYLLDALGSISAGTQGLLEWLLAPADGARPHAVDGATAWHGRLMVLSWALLLPVGVMAARFFKVTPRQDWPRELDNKLWWHTHLLTQYAGGTALLVAFVLAVLWLPTGTVLSWHGLLGWCVVGLAAVQFSSAWLRGTKGGPTEPRLRGDHYDMTRRRRWFERVHRGGGYVALTTAWAAMLTGLDAANGPRWMWVALLSWGALLVSVAAWLQVRGFARDTYQAIWGPGTEHPGNAPGRRGGGAGR